MNPSLLITPNSGEAGKLFSIIPTNGAGDLDVVRATSATRVNEQGLIEIPRTNLLLRSEEFDNSSWAKTASTVTANATTSPSGIVDADTFTANGINAQHQIHQTGTVTSGLTYTTSIYAKKNTNSFIQIYNTIPFFGSNVWANFDLNNGVVGSVGTATTASIQNVGNGWYRCTITGTAISSGTSSISFFHLISSETSVRGEGNSLSTSVFLWGAQLEQGITATEYIPTTSVVRTRFAGITQDGSSASNIARLDYSNGSCPSILVEPQRTNLVFRSNEFDNNYWERGSGVVVTLNGDIVNPNGINSTFSIIASTSSYGGFIRAYPTVLNSTAYTFSFYAKKNNHRYIGMKLNTSFNGQRYPIYDFDTDTLNTQGTSGVTLSRELLTNGWVRIMLTYTTTTTANSIDISIAKSNGDVSTPFSGGESVYIYGAQLEAGSNATSYIPTTTTSVTRNADVISKSGISNLIGQTEGTIYIDTNINYTALRSGIFLVIRNQANAINRLQIFFNNNANNNIAFNHAVNGVSNLVNSNIVSTGNVKIAIAYKSGQPTTMYLNGIAYSTAGNIGSFTATIDSMYYGIFGDTGSAPYDGLLGDAMIFKTRLTNTELQQLTTL